MPETLPPPPPEELLRPVAHLRLKAAALLLLTLALRALLRERPKSPLPCSRS